MLAWLSGLLLACSSSLLWPAMLPWQVALILIYPGCLLILSYSDPVSAQKLDPRCRTGLFFAGVITGVAWLSIFSAWQQHGWLPEDYWAQDINVTGKIEQLPRCDARKCRFRLRVEQWQPAKEDTDLKYFSRFRRPQVQLSWYGEAPQPLRGGQRWQMTVRLKPVISYRNQGSFDRQRWALAEGVTAQGYVRQKFSPSLLSAVDWQPREQMDLMLRQQLQGQPQAMAWFRALILGERDQLSDHDWQLFQATGTGHLFAISGLHVGLVFAATLFITRFSLVFLGFFTARQIGGNSWLPALGIALFSAACYAALAGWSLPTVRAFTMLAIATLTLLWLRRLGAWRVLGICLTLNLLVDPFAVLSNSFWLSYGAVGVILLLHWAGRLVGWRFTQLIRLQFGLLIGLTPLTILMFGVLAPGSVLANLLAVPVVGFLVVPALLLATLCLVAGLETVSQWLFMLAEQLMKLLFVFLEMLAAWIPLWPLPALPLAVMGLLLLGCFLFMLPAGWPGRGFSPLLLAICFGWWLWPQTLREPHWQVHVLDVGQGLSVVIESQGEALVYDTGDAWPGSRPVAASVLAPFLRVRGLTVKHLVISHGDRDHAGGAEWLLGELSGQPVMWSNVRALSAHDARACHAGISWQWQGLELRFLHPGQPTDPKASGEKNDDSCVLRISDGQQSVLLTGDIELRAERKLVADHLEQKASLQADILIAAHHGSKSSSSDAFIGAVDPQHVAISSGFLNRWRMPHPVVLTRFEEHGVQVWRTDQQGQISFQMKTDSPGVETAIDAQTPWFKIVR